MPDADFNLLVALDVLLQEQSVAAAARRLKLSPSAMSRTLARLRRATGDPLLVRAGRRMVPTPRARQLGETVGRLVQEVEAALRPSHGIDPSALLRTFTVGVADGFVETFGPRLFQRAQREAPGVRLSFEKREDRTGQSLRDGTADLEVGVVGRMTRPEVRSRALFRDRFVGVVNADHPLVTGPLTVERYAAGPHVGVLRHVADAQPHGGPIDPALAEYGLKRTIAVLVDGFAAALAFTRAQGLVATVPERHTAGLCHGLVVFPLPMSTPVVTVSMLWHPRFEVDLAHRWLRTLVVDACAQRSPPGLHPPDEDSSKEK
ncbi:MAG: LysR family transcriptional regulator [Myxococcota bacterium]